MAETMKRRFPYYLASSCFAVLAVWLSSADAGRGQQPAPAKAEIDALPPVGKGHELVRPYQRSTPEPVQVMPGQRRGEPGKRVPVPLSREIVPPSYRYGTPGYPLDGRGGRGYDFGYPGYRDSGSGGYPHHRSYGNSRGPR